MRSREQMAPQSSSILSAVGTLLAMTVLLVTPALSAHGLYGTEFYSKFKPVGPTISSRRSLSNRAWHTFGGSFIRSYSLCGLSEAEVVLATGSLELAAEAYCFHANVLLASPVERISILVTDINNAIRSLGLPLPYVDQKDELVEQLSSALSLANRALMPERINLSCREFVAMTTSSSTTEAPVATEPQTSEQPDANEETTEAPSTQYN
eukprot:GHVS01026391.1.p1 GENE.GHVS01026391.1~~GHVS01026391.1.p1  ORF type:complete len:209 (+),score=15.89 GHVS01026391.1:282-908(+)